MSSKQIAELVQASIQAALANVPAVQQVAAPVVAAAPVTAPKNGKIHLAKPAASKGPRKDERDPATIITIAKDSQGNPVTLGFSKTYGFGVQVEGTMIFHKARKWEILAQVAPMVQKAITERYES